MMAPCSVKAKGGYRRPPHPDLEVANCDLKMANVVASRFGDLFTGIVDHPAAPRAAEGTEVDAAEEGVWGKRAVDLPATCPAKPSSPRPSSPSLPPIRREKRERFV
jgi:hypothetical protein